MKKIVLIVLMFLICSASALAEEQFDGYDWVEFDDEWKSMLLVGFLTGHRTGEWEGKMKAYPLAYTRGALVTMKTIEKEMNTTIDKTIKLKIASATEDHFVSVIDETPLSTYDAPSPFKMVAELDAFYRTYPLCKGKRIDLMLSDFIKVWSREDKKTYKEIGDKCAE